jgi:hypothetical protein
MANIQITTIELPFGKRRFEYAWMGADDDTAYITNNPFYDIPAIPNLKPGVQFWLGHLHLIVVDFDFMRQVYEVALMGGRGYRAMIARRFLYGWQNFQARIILTLYVWGLADRHQELTVSWRWVHWGRKR